MRNFYGLLLALLFGIIAHPARGQFSYDDEVCLDKTPRQIQLEYNKKRFMEGMNKTFIYLSYLNYRDRTVDRVVTGVEEFEPYRGKIIRNINIEILDPFGVSIEKPENDHPSRFQKFANGIQINTKPWVIKNDLLFKNGQRVDPQSFADTERNLWERETFKDLKIYITEVAEDDDYVDVTVIVQDRWSWTLISGVQYNKAEIGLQFQNFMGLPHSITNTVSFNFRKDNFYTVGGNYQYNNIKASHIDIKGMYYYQPASVGGDLIVRRPFFSANSRWAGHIKTGIYKENKWIPNAFSDAIPTNVFVNTQDIWLATSFKLSSRNKVQTDLTRLVLSTRLFRKDYLARPFKRSADGELNFTKQFYFLGSIGIAQWDYYLDHSVYYLGQAEYFTKGLNTALIMGFDNDEDLSKRFYSGVQFSYGKFIERLGYLNSRASYGGFMKRSTYEQILFKVSTQFFTVPIKLGKRFMMRQFINAYFNVGFNRPAGYELVVNDKNGLRGIFGDQVRGTRSYVFNFETDVYPTFKIAGFNSSAFAFADLAITQNSDVKGYNLSQAYGAGIRLRNLGMGIGFFDLTVAYYPKMPVTGLKPYGVLAGFENNRAIEKNNLFDWKVLQPDY